MLAQKRALTFVNSQEVNMDELKLRLSQTEVFNKLSEPDLVRISTLVIPRRRKPGEFLCHQGNVWPNVIFIDSGKLQWAMLSTGGSEHVLFTLKPDDTFWAHSIFDDNPMPASLMATQDSNIFIWPRNVILPILYRNPEAMWEITGMLTKTMRKARDIIYGLAFQPVAGRLAALLLPRFENKTDNSIARDLTLAEIATRIASSPEVVCRLLQQFQADGLLEITRASLTLHNYDALENIAKNT